MENIRDKYCFVEDEAIVLGNIIASPELIQKEDIKKEYFTSEFRVRFFEVLENLSKMDDTITRQSVGNYLRGHAATEAIFTANRWEDWFEKQVSYVDRLNFKCSLGRIQKSKYLRDIRNALGDRAIKEYYDPDLLESKDREESLVYFDSLTIEDIQESISQKVNNIALDNFGSSEGTNEIINLSAIVRELYENDKDVADYGMPFFDVYKNTTYRGLREGCFYLRSASTGFGKSRSMMGDACNLAFDEIYLNGEWIKNGVAIPVLFVSTEQREQELYRMILAFISGVNEEKIRTKKYDFDELERVNKAVDIFERCYMYVLPLSDFTINEMRQKIVHGLSRYGVKFVFYDYLHTTPSMMARFTKDVRVAMREDQILSAFANELKSIAMENNIFIMSATQLNASYKESDSFPDQNFIRGSKAVADKIDAGEIMGEPTEDDLEALKTFLKNNGLQKPDTKTAIYKNRSSPYNKIYLWGWADRGCCRFTTGFATNEDYEVIENFNPTILEKGE